MNSTFRVSIYNDSPAASPSSMFFDCTAESAEDARQRGLEVAAKVYASGNGISVYARHAGGADHRNPGYPSMLEQARLVRFPAVHLSRVCAEVGPLDFVKIPRGKWWFEKAECYMSAAERAKMAASGIPFEVRDTDHSQFVFTPI